MKLKELKHKILLFSLMPALSAGFLFPCGFYRALPAGVTVDGVEVGGLAYAEAAARVRKNIEENLKGKTLEICSDGHVYRFAYPEISYRDNLKDLLKSVRRGGSYSAQISYYLCGFDEIARHICEVESISARDAAAIFSAQGEPFSYSSAETGRRVDEAALRSDVISALAGGFGKVTLNFIPVKYRYDLEEVKKHTVFLSSYTTYYDEENINRSSNIRLAAQSINGTVVDAGGTFSFNGTVGVRNAERGYLPAKIIENGKFIEGVGGGVCQVSTTLYNAAALAGMKIEEYHPHSLPVSYAPPSRDAMVSGTRCDLKFINTSDYPVYIRAYAEGNYVKFAFYGSKGEANYSLSSVVTGSLPAGVETTEKPEEVKEGKDGLTSECYLITERGGYIKRTLLRKDRYLPQNKVELCVQEDEADNQNIEGNAQN